MNKAILVVSAALCATVCSAPAQAQDTFGIDVGGYNHLLNYAQIKHNSPGALDPLSVRNRYIKRGGKGQAESSLNNSLSLTVRRSKTVRAPSGSAGALAFRPSASVRRRVLAGYVEAMRKTNPDGAAKMQKVFASQDIFAFLGRGMARYGLKTNNIADAMTLYVTVAWLGARGSNADLPQSQVRAVRGQMARALASTPALVRATGAQKQEMSDSLLVQALLFDGFIDYAKQQPATMPQARAIIAQSVRASFGLDLNTLKLTNQGLRM